MPDLSNVTQLDFGPFASTSETSRQAALANYPRQGTQRHRILAALGRQDMTRDELVIALGLRGNTIRPRVRELIDGGWVVDTGKTRKTNTGADAEVLALTVRAINEVREAA